MFRIIATVADFSFKTVRVRAETNELRVAKHLFLRWRRQVGAILWKFQSLLWFLQSPPRPNFANLAASCLPLRQNMQETVLNASFNVSRCFLSKEAANTRGETRGSTKTQAGNGLKLEVAKLSMAVIVSLPGCPTLHPRLADGGGSPRSYGLLSLSFHEVGCGRIRLPEVARSCTHPAGRVAFVLTSLHQSTTHQPNSDSRRQTGS